MSCTIKPSFDLKLPFSNPRSSNSLVLCRFALYLVLAVASLACSFLLSRSLDLGLIFGLAARMLLLPLYVIANIIHLLLS